MTAERTGGASTTESSATGAIPRRTRATAHGLGCVCALLLLFSSIPCWAQLTFPDALRLAVHNSPKIKAAQNDLEKAEAGLRVLKDIYIPSVVLGGGVGDAYGIMLSVPTIFTVNAQSLVFSMQQRSYIHGAHADLNAARLSLQETRQQVEEDAAITYLSLDRAEQTAAALDQQYGYAQKLLSIMQHRVAAQLDPELELKKTERAVLQIHLQQMQAHDDLEDLRGHLAQITGLNPGELQIDRSSIPPVPNPEQTAADKQALPDTPGIQAAAETAKAKLDRARGDAQYAWRPIVSFGANYGRVSPIENVQKFYNLNGIYNVASFGVSLQLPILDRVRSQAAKQSRLDAERAQMDLEGLRSDESADRHKLARSIPELNTKAEMADLDDQIAQEQLKSARLQSQHDTGGPIITPKDEVNAQIQERQKYLDMLDARFQARKAEISFLRLTGQLDAWVGGLAVTHP